MYNKIMAIRDKTIDRSQPLRWWRKKYLGQTLYEFAENTGLHRNTIQKLEKKGLRKTETWVYKRIIDYLNIEPNDLRIDP